MYVCVGCFLWCSETVHPRHNIQYLFPSYHLTPIFDIAKTSSRALVINLLSYCVSLIANLCGFRMHHLILYESLGGAGVALHPWDAGAWKCNDCSNRLANTFHRQLLRGMSRSRFSSSIELPVPIFWDSDDGLLFVCFGVHFHMWGGDMQDTPLAQRWSGGEGKNIEVCVYYIHVHYRDGKRERERERERERGRGREGGGEGEREREREITTFCIIILCLSFSHEK